MMKRLFILSLLLSLFLGVNSQNYIAPNSIYGLTWQRIKLTKALNLPTIIDTTDVQSTDTTNLFGAYKGKLYYYFNHHWKMVGSGVSTSSDFPYTKTLDSTISWTIRNGNSITLFSPDPIVYFSNTDNILLSLYGSGGSANIGTSNSTRKFAYLSATNNSGTVSHVMVADSNYLYHNNDSVVSAAALRAGIYGHFGIGGNAYDSTKVIKKNEMQTGLTIPAFLASSIAGDVIGYNNSGEALLTGSVAAYITAPSVNINTDTRKGFFTVSNYSTHIGSTHKIKGSGYDFVFICDTLIGWKFVNIRTGKSVQIDTSLNLLVEGKVTSQGIYGGIYVTDGASAQTIATGTTYTKMTCFATNGLSSNCTSDAANDKITITKTGKYYLNWSMSASTGTNNITFSFTAFQGGTELAPPHSRRKISTAGDVCAFGGQGFINVTSVPVDIDLRCRHDNGASIDITPVYANLTVQYIGE